MHPAAAPMRPFMPQADRVGEVMGAGPGLSTGERKHMEKQKKLSYGDELKQQMAAAEEAKRREKAERRGLPMPMPGAMPHQQPQQQHVPGPADFGTYRPPQLQHMGGPPPPGPADFGVPGGGFGGPPIPAHHGGPPEFGMPVGPSFDSPPPHLYGGGGGPPNAGGAFGGETMLAGGHPAGGVGGGYDHGGYGRPPPGLGGGAGMHPGAMGGPGAGANFDSPPRPNYGPPPPAMGGSPGPGMGMGMGMGPGSPGMGMGAGSPGMGMGMGMPMQAGPGERTMARMEKQNKQNAYRMELEAQQRSKREAEERRKQLSMQEAQARAMAAGAAAMGGGMMQQAPPAMGMGVGAMSPQKDPLMGMPAGPGGGPVGMGLMDPMGGAGPTMSPMAMGGGVGMGAGAGFGSPNPNAPLINFKNGKYETPNEIDAKQRAKQEYQEALERQIAEKQLQKEQEKQRRLAEMQEEEERIRQDQEELKQQFEKERRKEKGDPEEEEKNLHDAWEKARLEAEELKRQKFAAKRGHAPAAAPDAPEHTDNVVAGGVPEWGAPPAMDAPVAAAPAAPRLTTPEVAEKVRSLAEQEIGKFRDEMAREREAVAAEAETLRHVVQEQNREVAALQEHAKRMADESAEAKARVNEMRVDMIRGSMAAPESIMRILSDYPQEPSKPAPPSMLDIALDIPPPAAMLRRDAGHEVDPAYDMGPLVPGIPNQAQVEERSRKSKLINEGPARPPTQGLRTINPLEASMAGDSVFIYPGGRELPKDPNARANANAAAGLRTPASPGAARRTAAPMMPIREGSVTRSPGPRSPGQAGLMAQGTRSSLGPGERSMAGEASMPGDAAWLSPSELLPVAPAQAVTPPPRHRQPEGAEPATPTAVRAARAGVAQQRSTVMTPVDVDTVMRNNADKLAKLQELTALSGVSNVEAIDDFLQKYSKAVPPQTAASRGGEVSAGPSAVRMVTPARPSGAAKLTPTGTPSNLGMPPLPHAGGAAGGTPMGRVRSASLAPGGSPMATRRSPSPKLPMSRSRSAAATPTRPGEDALDAEVRRVAPDLPASAASGHRLSTGQRIHDTASPVKPNVFVVTHSRPASGASGALAEAPPARPSGGTGTPGFGRRASAGSGGATANASSSPAAGASTPPRTGSRGQPVTPTRRTSSKAATPDISLTDSQMF